MKTKKLYQKVLSLILAMAMVVTVFAVSGPEEVSAAGSLTFKGSGSSTVKITDEDCYTADFQGLQTHYIKFKASATGYITLTFKCISNTYSYSYGTLQLCNSKKKALSLEEDWDNYNGLGSMCYTRTYGVEKGQTYYFKVACDGGTQIKATVKTVKKGKNSSKKKATALTKKKKTEGVIVAGKKTADWYKIKLTKSAKLRLTYTAKVNGVDAIPYGTGTQYVPMSGGIKITFLDTKGKKWGDGVVSTMTSKVTKDGWDIFQRNKYTGAIVGINPGTYYVKVEPTNTKFSGEYSLKWTTY